MAEAKSSSTKKMKCSCQHDFQDARYGKGVRVFNEVTKEKSTWRCTVCGAKKTGV